MLWASARASRKANCAVGGHGLPVLLSLQAASTAALTQPVVTLAAPLAGLQVSVVQDLLSLQAALTGVMRQPVVPLAPMLPGLQVSVVQDFESLHEALFGVLLHAPLELQASVVQDFPSSHAALSRRAGMN